MAAIECPHFGYNASNNVEAGYSHITHEQAAQAGHDDDIHTLQAEVQRLDELISHLNQERASVLSNINSLQAQTRDLPPEILSAIFQIARPPIKFEKYYIDLHTGSDRDYPEEGFHHTLATVSKLWRTITLSTPRLWTTFTLRVDHEWSIDSITSLLNLYFQRARSFPVSVEIDFHAVSIIWSVCQRNIDLRKSIHSLLKPLKTALFIQNAGMIGHLSLIEPPPGWLRFSKGNFLSQCRSVTIFRPRPVQPREPGLDIAIDLTKLPCLERLQLIGCKRKFSIPETVSTLHFGYGGATSYLEEITRFPHVSELEFVECRKELLELAIRLIGRPLDSEGSTGTPVLPNLCKLSIIYMIGVKNGQGIVGMLEALYIAKRDRGRFHLVVEPMCGWYHEDGVLERLKRLVKDGFDLEVVTGSQMLDLA